MSTTGERAADTIAERWDHHELPTRPDARGLVAEALTQAEGASVAELKVRLGDVPVDLTVDAPLALLDVVQTMSVVSSAVAVAP